MKHFTYLSSVHFHAVNILVMVGIVLICSSADSILSLLIGKAIGFASLVAGVMLGTYWYRQGKMSWIDTLLNQGEE